MNNEINNLREFGRFSLDTKKKVLWFADKPVNLALKEIELLCVLTESSGEVLTKDELLNRVWADSFVEESNLSRYIYRLRKTFEEFGESPDLIQTVPRRGYRFTGEIHEKDDSELIIEKHTISRTLIEELEDSIEPQTKILEKRIPQTNRLLLAGLAFVTILTMGFGYYFYNRNKNTHTDQPIKSIAVLPLKTFSNNSEDEELRLRIADAVITRLGGLKDIVVRPTNSIVRFVKVDTDAIEAGKNLDVDAILDGRIQIEGEKLRVTLQLVSVESGNQLWSGQFDGKKNEILKLQDVISSALMPKLGKEQDSTLAKNPTTNSDAYEFYLKGRYFWNQRTPDSYFKAIGYFEDAIRLDSNFALAYSGLADSYVLLNRRNATTSEEALPKAEEAARKALELDDTLAETHNSMGLVKSVYNRNWQQAETHYRRAIELNPNYAIAYGWYGMLLSAEKRFNEAETQLRKAEQLDPTSRNIAVYLTVNLYNARQFDRAIEQSRKALELDPKLSTAYLYLSQSFEQKEMFDQAVEFDLERQKIIDPKSVEPLREAYRNSGIRGFWLKQIEVRKEQVVKNSACTYEIATRYALLNKNKEALKIIEDSSLYGGTCWNAINVEPAFDSLRSEPRFQEILRKMNIPLKN